MRDITGAAFVGVGCECCDGGIRALDTFKIAGAAWSREPCGYRKLVQRDGDIARAIWLPDQTRRHHHKAGHKSGYGYPYRDGDMRNIRRSAAITQLQQGEIDQRKHCQSRQ